MKELDHIQRVYFLGIGGIGMSALARYMLLSGREVAGYDRTRTPLTLRLEAEGIPVHYTDDPGLVPPVFMGKEGSLVVYTPAIPRLHRELNHFLGTGHHVIKRAELLGMVSRGRPSVAIAGTHGKTSVSTLLAHILTGTPGGCTAFLGGISKNYDSNLLRSGSHPVYVMEADEYDRSFHQLSPSHAIVTSMDADHLDIYGAHAALKEAFAGFLSRVGVEGNILTKKGLGVAIPSGRRPYTYSAREEADFYPVNRMVVDGRTRFDLVTPGAAIPGLDLGLPGTANVENAVAACSMAWLLGTREEVIRQAVSSFTGVQRRFDFQIRTPELVYMDDYAHHPEEIRACLTAVRETFPGRLITGIFQPHLYSRTRDFAEGFAESLGELDHCVLVDIYPAREEPVPGVSSDLILQAMKEPGKVVRCKKEEIIEKLKGLPLEVVLSLGAGDIDTQVGPIREWLLETMKKTK